MTTTELTGAEDVAWDLSDLYDGSDDPRLEEHIQEAEQAAAAFRDRFHGKVAELGAAELADAIAERERIEEVLTRVGYFAHLHFATDMADPPRGALVARITEKGAALDTQLLFFGLEIADLADDAADGLLAERRDRWLVGTVAEVVGRIEELRALGVTRVFLQHLNHSDDAMVALIGDRLLPALE